MVTWKNHEQYGDKQTLVAGRGRYVKINLPRTDYLSLAEVQVFDSNGNNIALNRNATQSSTYEWNYAASKAVDGDTDGVSVTATESERNPWWQVDLGAVKDIDRIVIYNRTNCCQTRLNDATVIVF